MAEDISYIRKWIKRGLSKDKKTLDFSNKGINNLIAEELAENVALPDIEILYLHTNNIKDEGLEELANSDFFEPLKELWVYENKIGELVGGVVKRLDRSGYYLDLGNNSEAFLPRRETIPKEPIRPQDRIKAILKEIDHDL